MQTNRRVAARLLRELGDLTEGKAVEHLAVALQAAERRGLRKFRRYAAAGESPPNEARDIQRRILRAATVLQSSDPTAAGALRDYGNRITNEWGYRP